MDANEIRDFITSLGLNICYDTSHAKLFCNWAQVDFYEHVRTLLPYIGHLHLSDGAGLDGEGLQIGEGAIDWVHFFHVLGDYHGTMIPEIWRGHQRHGEVFPDRHPTPFGGVFPGSRLMPADKMDSTQALNRLDTTSEELAKTASASPTWRARVTAHARQGSGAPPGPAVQRLDPPHRVEPECGFLVAAGLEACGWRAFPSHNSSATAV